MGIMEKEKGNYYRDYILGFSVLGSISEFPAYGKTPIVWYMDYSVVSIFFSISSFHFLFHYP